MHLAGWYATADGGEGDLVAISTDKRSLDNRCTIFVDAAGNRFRRLNTSHSRSDIDFFQCGAGGDGTTDDTAALQAAINAAAASAEGLTVGHPPGAPYGGVFSRVFCPAGIFLTNNLVVNPGNRIELIGEHAAGVAGCQIKAVSSSVDVLTILADTFRMDDVWIFGGSSVGLGRCLVLGSARLMINDSTISNSWISNCSNAGIDIVNGQGIFINNTTVEIVLGVM